MKWGSEEFNSLLEEYIERFNKGIPVAMPPKDEENFGEIMRECLRTGNPYEPPPVPEGCIA